MRSIASLFALSAVASSIAACGASSATPEHRDVAMAKSTKPRDVTPAVDPPTADVLQKANGAFAHDLHGKVVALSPTEDATYSPYSISVALAMTYAGANGTTATEMAKTLHVDGIDPFKAHAAFDKLDLDLSGRAAAAHPSEGHSPFELHVVNSLWGTPRDQWGAAFLDTLAVDYGSGIRLTDFAKDPEGARSAINGWVADETKNKIPELLGPGTIGNDTAIVLVDAIYFHGAWTHPFESSLTKDAPFHRLDGNTSNVPTMSKNDELSYASGDGFEAVLLPYDGVPMQMTIVVPKAGTFASFESSFTGDQLDAIEASASIADVNLTLPKFKIQGTPISLKRALSELGMPTAFTAQADFSPMTASDQITLSDVIHQAFVSVDEQGTEAAAATAVIGVGTAAPSKVVTLNVDRPFLFFVRDVPTKTTLFAGRVVNPQH